MIKNIRLNQPKYVIPLILLPFTLIGNFLGGQMGLNFDQQEIAKQAAPSILNELPQSKRGHKERSLMDNVDFSQYDTEGALFSDIENPDEIQFDNLPTGRSLSEEEMFLTLSEDQKEQLRADQKADSIKLAKVQRLTEQINATEQTLDQQLLEATNRQENIQQAAAVNESADEREMRLFKEQMAFMDSLTRSPEEAAKLEYIKEISRQDAIATKQLKIQDDALLEVSSANGNVYVKPHFNTVMNNPNPTMIKAIIDEEKMVTTGSTIRMRLLEEILVGNTIIPKGTYLHGQVSFATQRVNIKINSLLLGGQVLRIGLSIYDSDGISGLHVPISNFREAAKQGATQNIQTLGNADLGSTTADAKEKFFFGLLNRSTRAAGQTVSKVIRTNKAKIKYQTVVYLVDQRTLTNNRR